MTDLEKLFAWKDMVEDLKALKIKEAALRTELCLLVSLPNTEGTKKGNIGGQTVKVVRKFNITIDKEALTAIWEELNIDDKESIRFNPELTLAKYKKLPKDSLLHEIVTEKPGLPSLEVL